MAKPNKPERVRYQVLAPVFVNGTHIDPKGSKDVFVHAEPGLEGKALKLAPEKKAPAPKDGEADIGSGSQPGAEANGAG